MAEKDESAKRPVGRPRCYTIELAEEICDRLSNGETLNKICKSDHIPVRSTVSAWYLYGQGLTPEECAEFSAMYVRARESQAEYWHDDMRDRVTDAREDRDAIAKAKLVADQAKWSLARMSRARYGDRTEVDIGGNGTPLGVVADVNASVDLSHMSAESQAQLRKLAREAIQSKKK